MLWYVQFYLQWVRFYEICDKSIIFISGWYELIHSNHRRSGCGHCNNNYILFSWTVFGERGNNINIPISSRRKNYNVHINLLFEVFVLFKFSDVSLSLFQSEEIFYSISSTPWYLWNTKNRKIFQLFLSTAQTPLVLSCSDIIVVNNELLIKVGI